MTKHHEMLLQQFHQLTDVRNELKQAIDTAGSTSQDNKTSCLVKIDEWERDNISASDRQLQNVEPTSSR